MKRANRSVVNYLRRLLKAHQWLNKCDNQERGTEYTSASLRQTIRRFKGK